MLQLYQKHPPPHIRCDHTDSFIILQLIQNSIYCNRSCLESCWHHCRVMTWKIFHIKLNRPNRWQVTKNHWKKQCVHQEKKVWISDWFVVSCRLSSPSDAFIRAERATSVVHATLEVNGPWFFMARKKDTKVARFDAMTAEDVAANPPKCGPHWRHYSTRSEATVSGADGSCSSVAYGCVCRPNRPDGNLAPFMDHKFKPDKKIENSIIFRKTR